MQQALAIPVVTHLVNTTMSGVILRVEGQREGSVQLILQMEQVYGVVVALMQMHVGL